MIMPRIVAGRHTKAAGVGAGSNGRPQRYRAPHPPILRTDSAYQGWWWGRGQQWPTTAFRRATPADSPDRLVVVAAIDRLGRSVAEVTRTIAELGERGITLRALREGV